MPTGSNAILKDGVTFMDLFVRTFRLHWMTSSMNTLLVTGEWQSVNSMALQ